MNILLIGNGFDLEHKLPTSYNDFLRFCYKATQIFTLELEYTVEDFQKLVLSEWKTDESIKQVLLNAFASRYVDHTQVKDLEYDTGIRTTNSELNELYSIIKFNTWLRYFQEPFVKVGQNWIDFELEISKVIQALDAAKFQTSCGSDVTSTERHEQEILRTIINAAKEPAQNVFKSVATIIKFANHLNSELEKLIRALEIYLAAFVNKIPVETSSMQIVEIHPDVVLSFNYTNTYERVYGQSQKHCDSATSVNNPLKCDYIHGKADIMRNVESCNMVLGIDEYLDKDSRDLDLDFLTFKKYYQRIYKSTGNQYLDWVDEIKDGHAEYLRKYNEALTAKPEQPQRTVPYIPWQRSYYSDPSSIKCPQHTLFIFGHSLDATDKDVLRLFICNDNVQTKVFYHREYEDDKRSLGRLIKNLVKIMGQDELIRRTGGTHKTIEFIPQNLDRST